MKKKKQIYEEENEKILYRLIIMNKRKTQTNSPEFSSFNFFTAVCIRVVVGPRHHSLVLVYHHEVSINQNIIVKCMINNGRYLRLLKAHVFHRRDDVHLDNLHDDDDVHDLDKSNTSRENQ